MKLLNVIAGVVIAAVAVVAVNSAKVSATGTKVCKFEYSNMGGAYGLGQGFTKNPDVVSTGFRIVGDDTCRMDVTLTVWKIPHATLQPYPVEEQTYFSHQTGKQLKPGFYTLAAKVPACFWQADLVKGTNPTGPDGKLPYEDNRMLNATLGGDKTCKEEPKDECPNIEGMQTAVPAGYTKDADGKCVVVTGGKGGDVKAAQTPVALPATGPAALIGTFAGITASAGVAHSVVSRLKRK